MDDWGMDANSLEPYPIACADCIVEAPEFPSLLQHPEDGMQHESELPNTAIFAIPFLDFFFNVFVVIGHT
jgi:hypothetical protein